MRPKPAILIILDGWGIAPPGETNAVSEAKTPVMNKLITSYPAMTLRAAGKEAGFNANEAGNSEAGHLNIGAGRVVYQILPRINKAIADKTFFENDAFLKACATSRKNKSKLHLVGLVSPAGVHSSEEHLYALLRLAKNQKLKDVFIHAFLDGKDTIYNSGKDYILKLNDRMRELKVGKIASLTGRFYAMDQDNRWERTKRAYLALTKGEGQTANNPITAIERAYKGNVFDEEFPPTVISNRSGKPAGRVEDGDAVIFFNFQPDTARQLSRAFVADEFGGFERRKKINTFFVTMAEYEAGLPVNVAFSPAIIENPLAKVISEAGLTQFHIAETEKYAHITFFVNGEREEPFPGEERAVIPSPHTSSYDQRPEMSAGKIAERVIKEIKAEKYDFYMVNFANADMVGHTGNFKAGKKAVELLDKHVGEIIQHALLYGGIVFIASDHGNVEEMTNLKTGRIDKEHSANPAPFIIVGEEFEGRSMGLPESVGSDLSLVPPVGALCDIAPTILKVLGIKQPKEMTGKTLI